MLLGGPSVDEVALLVALVTLCITLVPVLWPERASLTPAELADDLAGTSHEQWRGEAATRNLHQPGVLPLTWAATERAGIADDVADPVGTASGVRVRRVRLDGRLGGRFDDVTAGLARDHAQLADGRLVLLGEPGAGKSVLALLLTLGLLDAREPGGPVPVLLSASSWDPIAESLDTWLVRSLAALYYNGRNDTPRRLLRAGLLSPVLDGLDEIPEASRRTAVQEINRTLGAARPLVVTCRAAEYTDLIRGGAPVLRRAPVIEVLPLAAEDVIGHLRAVSWPKGTDWEPVYRDLRKGGSPVAAALSTPLMVSLARSGYERCGGDPAVMLDRAVHDSRHSVENHLADRLIDAAYAGPDSPCRPEQARRWLTFLARHLHGRGDRDLAWWTLSRNLLSPWTAPVVGAAGGALILLMVFALTGILDTDLDARERLIWGELLGAIFALLATVLWYSVADRAPGRLSVSLRGSLGRLGRGMGTGTAVVALPCGLALALTAASISLGGWTLSSFYTYAQLVAMTMGLMLAVGLGIAAHNLLAAPPERSAIADPVRYLRADRRSALAGSAAAALVINATAFPAVMAGGYLGTIAGQAAAGQPDWATDWRRLGADARFGWGLAWDASADGPFPGSLYLIPGVTALGLLLITRAWFRFGVVRAVLGVRGHLPWRLVRFLADARSRGLLRQAGGVYQFRHIRLQERLATVHEATSPAGRRLVGRPRLIAVAAVLVLVGGALIVRAAPQEGTDAVIGRPGVDYQRVALSASGRTIAMSAAGGAVEVWRRDGVPRRLGRRMLGMPVRAIALDATGTRLAVAVPGFVHVLDAGDDELPPVGGPIAVAFSVHRVTLSRAGGDLAVIGGPGHMAVFSDGRRLRCDPGLRSPYSSSYGTDGAYEILGVQVVRDRLPGIEAPTGKDDFIDLGAGRMYAPGGLAALIWRTKVCTGAVTVSWGEAASYSGIMGTDRLADIVLTSAGRPRVLLQYEGGMLLFDGSRHPISGRDARWSPDHVIETGMSSNSFKDLALSGDGRTAAAVRHGSVRLWDLPGTEG